MTGEAFRELLEQYEKRLLPLAEKPSPPLARLVGVRGGRLVDETSGYAVVAPDASLRRSGDFRSRFPIVELIYRFSAPRAPQRYTLRTSPASLIQSDGHTLDEGFLADAQTSHIVETRRIASELTIRLIAFTETFATAPLAASLPDHPELDRFEVPPAATAIYGEGLVQYMTGQIVPISLEAPVPLFRSGEEGALEIRSGGVYAVLDAPAPALCQLGSLWIPTPKLS